MQISCSIIDWSEAKRRHAAGTLPEDLMNLKGDEEWIRAPDARSDSDLEFFSVGRIYQALAPHLSDENRAHGDASLGFAFSEDFVDELGLNVADCFRTLTPQRVSLVASEFRRVDYRELAELYDQHCPAEERPYASTFEEFKEYADQWQAAFSEAAAEGRGLFCYCN
jgi:hypothetical protein